MTKNPITNTTSMVSSWTIVLVLISFILLIVVIYNAMVKNMNNTSEGFQQTESVVVKEGSDVFDTFYVNLYDKLTFNSIKNDYEIGEIINNTKPTTESKVLDIGSGTGEQTNSFTTKGIPTIGVDQSNEMVRLAKEKFPDSTFIKGNIENSTLFSPDSFTHVLCLNYTLYYLENKRQFFNNCMKWLMPGGFLVVHLIEEDQVNPILPPSNPLAIIPRQLNTHIDITNLDVDLDGITYQSSFNKLPNSDVSIFTERFQNKYSNKFRKNKHLLYIQPDNLILTIAKETGFLIQGKINLVEMGYNHQYLYIFVKPN